MIVRTFDTAYAAIEFARCVGWTHTHDGKRVRADRVIDDEGVARELRPRSDRHGEFWYWGRM